MKVLLMCMLVAMSAFSGKLSQDSFDNIDSVDLTGSANDSIDGVRDPIGGIKGSKGKKKQMYACLPYKVAFTSMKACKNFQKRKPGKKDDRDCKCKKMGKSSKSKRKR
jgi:hypothetical protein